MGMTTTTWADAFVEALGVFLPVSCVGCGMHGRALCAGCRAELAGIPPSVRLVSGVRLDAAFEYVGLARTLVLALKVHGRLDLAGVLGRPTGRVLNRALAAAPPGTVVVRVPCSEQGRRRRGFDPVVVLLARGGVRRTGCLQRVRPPSRGGAGAAGAGGGQKSRSAVERVAATVGTLRAAGLRGRTVVLVDDVVTTGVTMAEAIRAVRAGGGTVVRCIATASVEPGK